MRGKARLQDLDGLGDGITPAYAGKSNVNVRVGHALGDHPRVCGEKIRKPAADEHP